MQKTGVNLNNNIIVNFLVILIVVGIFCILYNYSMYSEGMQHNKIK